MTDPAPERRHHHQSRMSRQEDKTMIFRYSVLGGIGLAMVIFPFAHLYVDRILSNRTPTGFDWDTIVFYAVMLGFAALVTFPETRGYLGSLSKVVSWHKDSKNDP